MSKDDLPPSDPDIEELPTVRISPAEVPRALRDLDVTCDSLPAELLSQALPFVAPATAEEQTIECQVSSLSPALPFSPSPSPPLAPSSEIPRVAELAAEVAVSKLRTLAREGISSETWASMELACATKIAIDLEAGGTKMRDAYDGAFLEARSAHRGAFGPNALSELRRELQSTELSPGLALDVADAIRFKRVSRAAS